MTAPWTPRERALREALEFYAKHEHWMQVCEHADNSRILIANGKYHTNGDGWEEAAAALADQPPPDPRDEALRLAEQCLSNIKDDLIRSINQTTLCHHGPINDREREAAALCCGEGYGNMMSILSTQWHLSVGGGAFVVGECVTTAQNQVKDIEAALAAIAAAKEEK